MQPAGFRAKMRHRTKPYRDFVLRPGGQAPALPQNSYVVVKRNERGAINPNRL